LELLTLINSNKLDAITKLFWLLINIISDIPNLLTRLKNY